MVLTRIGGRAPTIAEAARPRRFQVIRRFRKNRIAVAGSVILAILILVAITARLIAPYDPIAISPQLLAGPSPQHLLGTDEFGRDLLSRLIYGAQVSLEVGLISVSIALLAGTVIGITSAYFGGLVDNLQMRIMDVIFAFPGILLAIGITGMLGPGLNNVMVALGIIYTPSFARICRGSALEVMTKQYVEAAQVIGAPHLRVLTLCVLPNILGPLIVQTSVTFAFAILSEAALSYLGLGAQPPTPSWGLMLNAARSLLFTNYAISLYPGLAIMLAVLGFNFIGDGLRDALDPRTSA